MKLKRIAAALTSFVLVTAWTGNYVYFGPESPTIMASAASDKTDGTVQPVYDTNPGGTASNNVSANNYGGIAYHNLISNYASVVNSYLYEDSSELTRVESLYDKVVIEKFSADGKKLVSKQEIRNELPWFGGFYCGSEYNFLVFGQTNEEENDDVEILRVVKYTKDWKRLGSSSVNGANTEFPFLSGSLRMTETGGNLYIHTCHRMYKSADGRNHQANMSYIFNEESMELEYSFYGVLPVSQTGYVSHSFNQFIQTDGEKIYRVDHGDAYPRGIMLTSCNANEKIASVSHTIPMTFSGEVGLNYTGVSIGGFELSENNCLIAGNSVDQDLPFAPYNNIFVLVCGKDMTNKDTVWLTHYEDKKTVGTPQLVSLGSEQFLIMWEEEGTWKDNGIVKMAVIDEEGQLVTDIVTRNNMHLSDCQPILCSDGIVRWYVTNEGSPTIHSLNPNNLENLPDPDNMILGDVNHDDIVDIEDAVLIVSSINGNKDLDAGEQMLADVNKDGVVDIEDVVSVIAYINGTISIGS